jgi:hypothetical protein
MTTWEYLILDPARFESPTHTPGASAAINALNEEGARGTKKVRSARAHRYRPGWLPPPRPIIFGYCGLGR